MAKNPNQFSSEGEAARTRILNFYRSYYEGHGVPPTIRVATDYMGYSTTSATYYHLGILVERGLLKRPVNSKGSFIPTGYQIKRIK